MVVLPVDRLTGKLAGNPEIASSGFIDMEESEELLDGAIDLIAEEIVAKDVLASDEALISSRVRKVLANFFHEETGRRPMIVLLPMEV